MHIGIHAKALTEKRPTGVAVYTQELLRTMTNLPEASEHQFTLYTDAALKGELPRHCTVRELHAPFLWTQVRLACELRRNAPDVFFVPQHVLPRTAPPLSVATIHGLEFERFGKHYGLWEHAYLRYVTKDAVRRASRIIAVSEATKRDLVEIYRVPAQKISVVHHGGVVAERLFPKTRGVGVAPYFLYIGRIEKKKNVDGILRAFEAAKSRYRVPHRLVLAGGDGYGASDIRSLAASLSWKGDIEMPGYVSNERKWELLCGASAFVFPSWYEGFGLPILEAQTCGVPVITSDISSMPEIAGKGAALVDPADTDAIALALRRISDDRAFRENLVRRGYENTKRFSWEKCARETLAVLESLVS